MIELEQETGESATRKNLASRWVGGGSKKVNGSLNYLHHDYFSLNLNKTNFKFFWRCKG